MRIGILTLNLRLHGCWSLKEKRHRISGLRDRFGRSPNIAVCESGKQDSKQEAEISFVCAAGEKKPAEAALAKIVAYCHQYIDAEVINDELMWG